MSQSSFYGGRPGASFRIAKRFDGIDIPQNIGSIIYKKKWYAYETIENVDYYKYPFIEKTGSNYNDYNWKICELDGGNKNVVYNNSSTGIVIVEAIQAEGMIQCFKEGASTTNIVNYGEYVLIDTITDMCEEQNPDNGKIFRRGINLNYNATTNPYYGGELVGNIAGSKGDTGAKGDKGDTGDAGIQGPKGDKGDRGIFNILAIYDTAGDIPNQSPETIGGDNKYVGWDVLVGDSSDPDADYHLYVYDYLTTTWNDVGSLLGNSTSENYTVCETTGSTAAKTVTLTNFVLSTGASLIVKFQNANTADNPTLNVNNTGAKSLIANGASAKDVIIANSVFLVIYDGTNYVLVGGAGSGDGNFIGTTAEWNALSTQEKESYSDNIVFITDDAGGGSGGSGGHIILDAEGTSMTQRGKLKFANATVTDDSTNDVTIVTTSSDVPIATTSVVGKVKPDGSSITITNDGTISSISSSPQLIYQRRLFLDNNFATYDGSADCDENGNISQGGGSFNAIRTKDGSGLSWGTLVSSNTAFQKDGEWIYYYDTGSGDYHGYYHEFKIEAPEGSNWNILYLPNDFLSLELNIGFDFTGVNLGNSTFFDSGAFAINFNRAYAFIDGDTVWEPLNLNDESEYFTNKYNHLYFPPNYAFAINNITYDNYDTYLSNDDRIYIRNYLEFPGKIAQQNAASTTDRKDSSTKSCTRILAKTGINQICRKKGISSSIWKCVNGVPIQYPSLGNRNIGPYIIFKNQVVFRIDLEAYILGAEFSNGSSSWNANPIGTLYNGTLSLKGTLHSYKI